MRFEINETSDGKYNLFINEAQVGGDFDNIYGALERLEKLAKAVFNIED